MKRIEEEARKKHEEQERRERIERGLEDEEGEDEGLSRYFTLLSM